MKSFDKFLVPVKDAYVLKINKDMALSIQSNLFLPEAWEFLLRCSKKGLLGHSCKTYVFKVSRLLKKIRVYE